MPTTYETMIAKRVIKPRGWNRDPLVRFFENKTGFRSLPAYSAAELSPESLAQQSRKGWEIPSECFDRLPDESQKNSVRAFVRDKVLPFLATKGIAISPDEVQLSLQTSGKKSVVMVYRLAR